MSSAHTYLVALGSNQPSARHGSPRDILAKAADWLDGLGQCLAMAPVIASDPVGPSLRRYANGAALVATDLAPPQMLAALQGIEAEAGRERRGQRWRSRTLDLDIVLWSGGSWSAPGLQIPHPQFRQRSFVLAPASMIAPDWRDPVTGFTLRQLNARLTRNRPAPR
ncbi:2-amino-4-hydroxy-6-hydroxymethyldihydropteridine diphosphokinase [Aurantiacibacter gangjinensis]|uniref:2-amino-4-hydroxy-6-hydroxymethyldihydropteridine pyrophosphokinase n=1 Tax=Aurantiacibacter gangjinensis TaxID=502682 RepID=A0A0G9MM79_9SPHN|nr:2-amino-4-hydroxy-6-hydroxymethyldihydropteridine diphosphokinase [Aurantiacibacter gangjinensis]APE27809.1 2-amino-4-hydroxy-6- hydroxymethyldihydropteridine pyrophosphokinase [Aurantiacibacter gangjinensis]KLE31795.1 hypothetical protein AAW01_09870 [Aurantiacibacter gangjinensis]